MAASETEIVGMRDVSLEADVPLEKGMDNRMPRLLLWAVAVSFLVWLLSSYAIRDFAVQCLTMLGKLMH